MSDLRTYSTSQLCEEVAYLGLAAEIEEAVLSAIEAGQGPIPSFSGAIRPRETEEPVTLAITEALDDADCMAMLIAILNGDVGLVNSLKQTIALRWAANMEDGIREARENALESQS